MRFEFLLQSSGLLLYNLLKLGVKITYYDLAAVPNSVETQARRLAPSTDTYFSEPPIENCYPQIVITNSDEWSTLGYGTPSRTDYSTKRKYVSGVTKSEVTSKEIVCFIF